MVWVELGTANISRVGAYRGMQKHIGTYRRRHDDMPDGPKRL